MNKKGFINRGGAFCLPRRFPIPYLCLARGRKMAARTSTVRNDYRCSIERNQAGKYCVRIQVRYPRHAWTLGVFFLPSSFDRAMKKLEESLDFLQRQEEKLWVWGGDPPEAMGISSDCL